MNIEGTYTLQASPEEVWQCFKNKDLLLRTIPGLVRFEQEDSDTYTITLQIKHAPLMGTYHGEANITEKQYPHYYHIVMTGNEEGRQNSLSGNGSVHLNERGGNTIVTYQGTLILGKGNARLPHAMVKGAAKLLVQQFFTALSEQLHTTSKTLSAVEEGTAGTTVIRQRAGDIVVLPRVPQIPPDAPAQTYSVAHSIVRFLGLGRNDPAVEELWATRLRRAGILSGLLLLIWIGMRLPRRS